MELTQSIPDDRFSRSPSLVEKLTTIRQMLATLETVTIAGQRHLMTKVVAFVDGQVSRAISQAGPGNRRMLLEQLMLLKGEAGRQLPSVPVFGARAENLLALLTPGA